jgi:hypothetical protein
MRSVERSAWMDEDVRRYTSHGLEFTTHYRDS